MADHGGGAGRRPLGARVKADGSTVIVGACVSASMGDGRYGSGCNQPAMTFVV